MVDTAEVKATVSIVEVVSRYVELRKEGREYKGLCPFHGDRNPSMSVVPHKAMWYCHSCGEGGDAITFVQRIEACSFPRAMEILGAPVKPDRQIAYPKLTAVETPERKAFAPPEEHAAPPDMRIAPNANPAHPWKLVKTYTYHGTRREVLFYVGRYEWYDSDGECWKTYRAWSYGDDGWKCKHWHAPRPLYNLHNIVQSSDLPVALFEGEKCADAGGILGGSRWVASTWPGGAPNASKGDYSALRGRKVIVWPDADAAGHRALEDVLDALAGVAAEVWIVNVSDCADGWDAGNAVEDGWDAVRLDEWLRQEVGGRSRVYRHEYATGAKAPPPSPAPEPEPIRAPVARRPHSDIAATARHWTTASWRDKLIVSPSEKGKDVAIRCIENACMPLMYADEWSGLLAWDELRQCITATRPTPWGEQPDEWSDHHDTALECWYDRAGLHYKGLVSEAVNLVARRNAFHPVRDYLNSVGDQWDGTPRCDTWLIDYAGAEDTELTRFFSSRWLISAVARAMKPGEIVKTCLILFGPQDAGKSSIFRVLGDPWFTVQQGNIGGDSTKAIEQCSKAWIIEMAELAKVRRTDDVESIKGFLSTYEDTYRPAYARRVQTIKRCCVFAGTCNSPEAFSDTTGNVRFWPVDTGASINFAGLREVRDQLWAEAVKRYKRGERWWIEDERIRALAAGETEKHMVRDEWTDVIEAWLGEAPQLIRTVFTTTEIRRGALGMESGQSDARSQTRIANSMRALGYEYSKFPPSEVIDGKKQQRRGWRKKP